MERNEALGYVSGNTVSAAWVRCLTAAICSGRFDDRILSITCGPVLSRGRNLLAGLFLKTGADRLLMVDTDIIFTPRDVDDLLEYDAPVVYGRYAADNGRRILRGCGFVAIRREVLEAFDRWFDYMPYEGVVLGEDESFYQRVVDAGFEPVYADVTVGHEKPRVIRP